MRSDVIARRFCDGESTDDIAYSLGVGPHVVEQALRRRMETLLERKRK